MTKQEMQISQYVEESICPECLRKSLFVLWKPIDNKVLADQMQCSHCDYVYRFSSIKDIADVRKALRDSF